MSETKHTPGPWSLHISKWGPTKDLYCYVLADTDETQEEAEANREIMEAAPELLAELKEINKRLKEFIMDNELYSQQSLGLQEIRDGITELLKANSLL